MANYGEFGFKVESAVIMNRVVTDWTHSPADIDNDGADGWDRYGTVYQVKYLGYGRGIQNPETKKQGKSSANNTGRKKMSSVGVDKIMLFVPHYNDSTTKDIDENAIDCYECNPNIIYKFGLLTFKKGGRDCQITNTQIKQLFNLSVEDKYKYEKRVFRHENVTTVTELKNI